MNGRSSQNITVPGYRDLPLGSTNLSCCLVQGVSTSTCLSCMMIGTGVLEFEVSITAELVLSEGILLVTGVVTGVCGIVVVFTRVSGSRMLGIIGCSWVEEKTERFGCIYSIWGSGMEASRCADEWQCFQCACTVVFLLKD